MKKLDSVQKRISFIYKLITFTSCLSFLIFLIVSSLVLVNYFVNNKTNILGDMVLPILRYFLIIFPVDGLLVFLILVLSNSYRLYTKKNISSADVGSFYDFARSDVICIDEGDILFSSRCTVKEVVALGKEKEHQIIDIAGSIASRLGSDDPVIYALQHLSFIPLFIDGNVEEDNGKYVAKYNGYKYVLGSLGTFKYRAEEFVKKKAEPYVLKGYEVLLIGKYEFDKKTEKYAEFADIFGIIVVKNDINHDFKNAINYFQDKGKQIIFLSSGNAVKASEQAKLIGLKNAEKFTSNNIEDGYIVYGDLNLEKKKELVARLQNEGRVVTTITNSGVSNSNCSISFNTRCGAEVMLLSKDASLVDAHEEAVSVYNRLRKLFMMTFFKTVFVSLYFLVVTIIALFGFEYDYRPIGLGAIFSVVAMVLLIFDNDKKMDNRALLPRMIMSSGLSLAAIATPFILFALQYNKVAYTGINDLNTCLTMSGVVLVIMIPMMFVSLLYNRFDKRRGILTTILFLLDFISIGLIIGLSLYYNKEIIGFYINLWNGQNILTIAMILFLYISFYFTGNYLMDNYKEGGEEDEN